MQKMKSKKAFRKRLKVTKSGKIRRSHAKTSHLFLNKDQKVKRKLRKRSNMDKADVKRYRDYL